GVISVSDCGATLISAPYRAIESSNSRNSTSERHHGYLPACSVSGTNGRRDACIAAISYRFCLSKGTSLSVIFTRRGIGHFFTMLRYAKRRFHLRVHQMYILLNNKAKEQLNQWVHHQQKTSMPPQRWRGGLALFPSPSVNAVC